MRQHIYFQHLFSLISGKSFNAYIMQFISSSCRIIRLWYVDLSRKDGGTLILMFCPPLIPATNHFRFASSHTEIFARPSMNLIPSCLNLFKQRTSWRIQIGGRPVRHTNPSDSKVNASQLMSIRCCTDFITDSKGHGSVVHRSNHITCKR